MYNLYSTFSHKVSHVQTVGHNKVFLTLLNKDWILFYIFFSNVYILSMWSFWVVWFFKKCFVFFMTHSNCWAWLDTGTEQNRKEHNRSKKMSSFQLEQKNNDWCVCGKLIIVHRVRVISMFPGFFVHQNYMAHNKHMTTCPNTSEWTETIFTKHQG